MSQFGPMYVTVFYLYVWGLFFCFMFILLFADKRSYNPECTLAIFL
nr:ATP synthase F0 subunit 8 [Chamelea striatula]